MEIKNWLAGWLLKTLYPPETINKSHQDVGLPYVKNGTFSRYGSNSFSPYNNNGTLRRAIDIIAYNLAQLPYKVYREGELYKPVIDPNNVFIGNLLENPNEITSGFKFKLTHWSYFLLYDKVYWLLNRNPFGIIKEIYTLHPRMLREVKDSNNIPIHYIYNNKLKIEKEDLIEFSGFNSTTTTGSGGSSILDTIKKELDTEESAANYGKKFFENGTRVSGVITGTENTTMEDMQKVLSQWIASHQGSDKAYKVGALLGGMKYEESGMTLRDAEYINGRKEIKDRIIEVYGIPKSVFGLVDKIDRATADTQMRQFWQVTLKPMAILLQEDINTILLRRDYSGYKVAFDFSVVEELKKDVNETADAAKKYFELGYTRNEINDRFRLDMSSEESGDIRYIPTSLMEINSPLEMEQLEEDKRVEEVVEKGIDKSINPFRVAFLKIQSNQEKIFYSKIKRYIFEYRSELIGLIKEKGIEGIEEKLDILRSKQDKVLIKLLEPLYLESTRVAEKSIYDLLNIDKRSSGNFELSKNSVLDVVVINKSINSKLKEEIRNSNIVEETEKELLNRLKRVYNFTTSKSRMIARTETTNVINEQYFLTFKAQGIKNKEWVTSKDSVRSDHRENAEQGVISIDKKFKSGELFPKSFNCRCSLIPVIK